MQSTEGPAGAQVASGERPGILDVMYLQLRRSRSLEGGKAGEGTEVRSEKFCSKDSD